MLWLKFTDVLLDTCQKLLQCRDVKVQIRLNGSILVSSNYQQETEAMEEVYNNETCKRSL